MVYTKLPIIHSFWGSLAQWTKSSHPCRLQQAHCSSSPPHQGSRRGLEQHFSAPHQCELASLFIWYVKFQIHPLPSAQQHPPGWVKAVPDVALFLYSNIAAVLCVQMLGSELPALKFFQHFIFPPHSPSYVPHPVCSYPNSCWVLRIHGPKNVLWVQIPVLAQAPAQFSFLLLLLWKFHFPVAKEGIGKLQSLLIQQRCKGEWVLGMSLDSF